MTMRSTTVPRLVVAGGTLAATAVAAAVFADVLRTDGVGVLDVALLLLFILLFAWVAQGFFTATLGFVLVLRDRRRPAPPVPPPGPLPRTAIVMPIYNEDPTRVMAGLRAIYDSLRATGYGDAFDLFVMSDTTDPERWLEEEAAWAVLCLETCGAVDDPGSGKGGVYYRRRPYNTARKSGNLADFCNRWGRLYDFMVVLDADSLMEGATLVEMVRRISADPRLALLQAPPQPINRESLFARMMQFAAAAYSPVFNVGFAAWTGDDGNYYGHNAVIRTQAFMEHCGLPHLPGEAPLGGEILSHDFVEAAMLKRNGFKVRIDPDLTGSYEEMPTTLVDYAKRDRRWCQGNLQHFRIALAKNMHPVSRLHLLMGVMAFVSSPLWLLFMVGMVAAQFLHNGVAPDWVGGADVIAWESGLLFAAVMAMLVLPKLYALIAMTSDRPTCVRFGGRWRALASVASETAFSVLLAPVMMAFHARFVWETLTGRVVHWVAQQRDEAFTPLREAFLTHRVQMVSGIVAAVLAYLLAPSLFWWLLPVTLGLVASPLVSSWTSRVDVGLPARALGLFLIPAETDPPDVLYRMHGRIADAEQAQSLEAASASAMSKDRFTRAVLDPTFNTLHVSLLRAYGIFVRETPQLIAARKKALEQGPASLTKQEKMAILSHEDTVRWLHGAAWQRWPVD